jgi:hypothetical protein
MWPHVYVICACLVFLSVGDLLVNCFETYNPLKTDGALINSERPGEKEIHGMCVGQFIHNNFH